MAPGNSASPDDFTFVMTCLKHATEKPRINFEEVAKELGAKSGNACYHRHWGIMKKFGITGNSGAGRKPGTSTPSAPKRRTKRPKAAEGSGEEVDAEGDATPAKKPKTTPKTTSTTAAAKKATAPAAPTVVKAEEDDDRDSGGEINGVEVSNEGE